VIRALFYVLDLKIEKIMFKPREKFKSQCDFNMKGIKLAKKKIYII